MNNKTQAFIRLNKWIIKIGLYRSGLSDQYRSVHYQLKKIWESLNENERDIICNYYKGI